MKHKTIKHVSFYSVENTGIATVTLWDGNTIEYAVKDFREAGKFLKENWDELLSFTQAVMQTPPTPPPKPDLLMESQPMPDLDPDLENL